MTLYFYGIIFIGSRNTCPTVDISKGESRPFDKQNKKKKGPNSKFDALAAQQERTAREIAKHYGSSKTLRIQVP